MSVHRTEVLVVGGGPGGLACATALAQGGAGVILAERKPEIGPKVCAGGITWHGLIRHVPTDLIERAFPEQHVVTPRQRITVTEPDPIVATVSRRRLGQWMAAQAEAAGVRLWTNTRVVGLEEGRAMLEDASRRRSAVAFDHLVGADGSNSLVRRWLGLPTAMGLGLNCMLATDHPRMEWHLDGRLFGSGYAWIFPHAGCCSVGVYSDPAALSARALHQRLLTWAAAQGFSLTTETIHAGLVNFDFRGLAFGRTWLVGDAAGLASALTGEGIYPALVSGQAVARMILDSGIDTKPLPELARKHRLHRRILRLAGVNPVLRSLFMELLVLLLRVKVVDFHALEMAE